MGLLIALDVVASAFLTINTPFLKIGVSFIPISFTGFLFGPLLGGAGAAIADVLQYFITSAGYAYIPGITVDAFLSGAVYGLLLHGHRPSVWRCLVSSAISEIVIGGFLTTFWLYLSMPGSGTYVALFLTRIVKCLIMTPIETAVVYEMCHFSLRAKIFAIPEKN